MILFWIAAALVTVALCFKRTHGALLLAVGLAFVVGTYVGHSPDLGPPVYLFFRSTVQSVFH